MRKREARIGVSVRLKGKKRRAHITHVMRDIDGGVVLHKELDGCHCWHVYDLERAPDTGEKP